MPSNGIQIAITGEITPTSLTDTFPVINPYWGLGGLRNVVDLIDRDAITSARREAGMIVFVASVGRYYKLESGLSNLDWTDLGTTLGGGGSSIPIVRYVYLIQDISDASMMGGTSKNVYTTFQSAYDAANTLQISLGTNSVVVILVGNTIATINGLGTITNSVGNLILNANYNPRVRISGINPSVSVLGDIIATNNSGNGFNIGTSSYLSFSISNVRLGNLSSSATGTSGNSGFMVLNTFNCILGNITSNITNVSNTTGSGGGILINSSIGNTTITSINNSSVGSLSTSGIISLQGNLLIGNLQGANSNLGSSVTIGTGVNITNLNINVIGTTPNNISITRSTLGTVNITSPGNSTITFEQCNIGTLTVLQNGNGVNQVTSVVRDSIVNYYDSNLLTRTIATSTTFRGATNFNRGILQNIGNNSIFDMCTFSSVDHINTWGLIDQIGTGCSIIKSNFIIVGSGTNQQGYSIRNNSNVSIISKGNNFAKGFFAIITNTIQLVELQKNTYTATSLLSSILILDPIEDDFVYLNLDTDVSFEMNPEQKGNPQVGKVYMMMVQHDGSLNTYFIDFTGSGVNTSYYIPFVQDEGTGLVTIAPTIGVTAPKYLIRYVFDGQYLWVSYNKNYT